MLKAGARQNVIGRPEAIILIAGQRRSTVNVRAAQGRLEIKRHDIPGRYKRLRHQEANSEAAFEIPCYAGAGARRVAGRTIVRSEGLVGDTRPRGLIQGELVLQITGAADQWSGAQTKTWNWLQHILERSRCSSVGY